MESQKGLNAMESFQPKGHMVTGPAANEAVTVWGKGMCHLCHRDKMICEIDL